MSKVLLEKKNLKIKDHKPKRALQVQLDKDLLDAVDRVRRSKPARRSNGKKPKWREIIDFCLKSYVKLYDPKALLKLNPDGKVEL